MVDIFKKMEQAIIDGDEEEAGLLAQRAVKEGVDPLEALERGFSKGMEVLGERFERGECFVPELLLAEEAMYAAVDVLKPRIELLKKKSASKGKVVIGTIQGDVHDIGKNIVRLFLSVSGFECIDVGRDVPVHVFIETALKENADIIATSALMTTTMVYMPELVKQLGERGIRDRFKVMVGGAPVIRSWAEEVANADGYARGAREAVEVASHLIK